MKTAYKEPGVIARHKLSGHYMSGKNAHNADINQAKYCANKKAMQVYIRNGNGDTSSYDFIKIIRHTTIETKGELI